jgi:hypothetical protein
MTYRAFPDSLIQVPDSSALFHPDGTGYSQKPGATAEGVTALDPLDIITSVSPRHFHIADLGISGTGVAETMTWADQAGTAIDYTQATDANKPTVAAHAAIGSRLALTADGSNDILTNLAFNLVANDWIVFVFMQDTWTISDTLYGSVGAVSRYAIGQAGVTPQMRLISNTAATPNNAGAVLSTWTRGRALCVNTVSAYLRLAATNTTGVAPGSGFGSGGRQIFGQAGGNFFAGKLAMIGVWAGEPSAQEMADLDTWITEYYEAGVAVG